MWNFVVSRSSASLRCNRSIRPGSSARKAVLRTIWSIACGCGWCVCFNWVVPSKHHGVDNVKITYICGSHTNTCDPSNVDRLVFDRTRARFYKICTDQVLSEFIVPLGGSYSINVQSMVEILRKALPERKDVNRHMVYNLHLRARRRKFELEAVNVNLLANYFDVSFINDYKTNLDNYSKGMFVLLYYACCLIM